uniref:Uncharacterized protein n=1 Tax=Molossus molossus TaxID=27622 RepID=A0A7J8CYX2_MOLMO|nr:hypothetical protein HJG59_009470 [Molossus molossus]
MPMFVQGHEAQESGQYPIPVLHSGSSRHSLWASPLPHPDFSDEFCGETGEGPLTLQKLKSSRLHPNRLAQLPEMGVETIPGIPPIHILAVKMPLPSLWLPPTSWMPTTAPPFYSPMSRQAGEVRCLQ